MKSTADIHALTSAEIRRQIALHSDRRQQITNERASLYAHALQNGIAGEPAPIDDDEKAAIAHAKGLLNGSAPESLFLPPDITRDKALYREQRGIDIVLKILSDKELVARAADAVTWFELHGAEWHQLARDITLTAIRLDALDSRARHLLEGCCDLSAVQLPMVIIANTRSISEIPTNDLKAAALAEGIVSKSEIIKVENVE